MNEILTESFCERCGTRYSFEPVSNKRKSLSSIGALGRGLRHFVSDPGTSLDEAFAVARSEREQRSTANALEAFHRTFNFCLSCRQYTCSDCWNTVEGRCLSCAPTPDSMVVAAPVNAADLVAPMDLAPAPAPMDASPADAPIGELEPFDLADLRAEARALAAAEAAAEAEAVAAGAAAEAEAEAAAEAVVVAEAEAVAEAAAVAEGNARAQVLAAEAEMRAAEAVAAEALAVEEAAAAAAALAVEEAQALATEAEAVAEAQAEALAAQAAAEADARAAAQAEALAEQAAAEAEALVAAQAAALAAQALAEAEAQVAAQAAATGEVLAFEPGLNLDDEIAAYERQLAAAADPTRAPQTAVLEEVAADVEAAPTEVEVPGIMVDPEPPQPFEPIPTAIGRPVPASAVEYPPSWPEPDVAAAVFEPAWPDGAGGGADAQVPVAQAAPAFGAARPCPSCGLALSASARFCRRCGTSQVADSR